MPIHSLNRSRSVLLGELHPVLRLARLHMRLLRHHRLRLRLLLLVELVVTRRSVRRGLRRWDVAHTRLRLQVRGLGLGLSVCVRLLLLLLLRDLLLLVRVGVWVVVCRWGHGSRRRCGKVERYGASEVWV